MALRVDHEHAFAGEPSAGEALEPRAHVRGKARRAAHVEAKLDGGLLVTVVGRPEGVTSTESAAGGSPNQLAKPRETPADREPAQR